MPLTLIMCIIRDQSDFGKIISQTVHPNRETAQAYANNVALPAIQASLDQEWWKVLDPQLSEIEFHW